MDCNKAGRDHNWEIPELDGRTGRAKLECPDCGATWTGTLLLSDD